MRMNDLPSQNYLFQWLEVFGNGQSSLKKKEEKLCQYPSIKLVFFKHSHPETSIRTVKLKHMYLLIL